MRASLLYMPEKGGKRNWEQGEQLRRTKIHFVHCFLPQHGAGLCDIKSKPKTAIEEGQMNVPLVRSQVNQIIAKIIIYTYEFIFAKYSNF